MGYRLVDCDDLDRRHKIMSNNVSENRAQRHEGPRVQIQQERMALVYQAYVRQRTLEIGHFQNFHESHVASLPYHDSCAQIRARFYAGLTNEGRCVQSKSWVPSKNQRPLVVLSVFCLQTSWVSPSCPRPAALRSWSSCSTSSSRASTNWPP